MALIKCEECGREISDNAVKCPNCGRILKEKEMPKRICEECGKELAESDETCLYCGCPSIKVKKSNPIMKSIGAKRRNIIICASILLVVLVCVVFFKVSSNNVFTPYLKIMGKSYKDIPEEYEVEDILDTLKVSKTQTEEIFGIPGEINYTYIYDENKGDFGNVDIISWCSTSEVELTEKQVNIFKNGIKKLYGKWDDESYEESEYSFSSDQTVYSWKKQSGYNIFMRVDEDRGGIMITWHDEDKKYND